MSDRNDPNTEMEQLRAEVSFWRASRWRLHSAWLSAQRRVTQLRTERTQMLADFQANDETNLGSRSNEHPGSLERDPDAPSSVEARESATPPTVLMSDDIDAQLVGAAAGAIVSKVDEVRNHRVTGLESSDVQIARAAVVATLRTLEDHGYGPDYADPSGVLTRLADCIEQGDGK